MTAAATRTQEAFAAAHTSTGCADVRAVDGSRSTRSGDFLCYFLSSLKESSTKPNIIERLIQRDTLLAPRKIFGMSPAAAIKAAEQFTRCNFTTTVINRRAAKNFRHVARA